jgi:hypothetical protein
VISSFVSADQFFPKKDSKPSSESYPTEPLSPSWNIPKKGLCVIINISEFSPSASFYAPERKGSHKDVEIIITVFKKLKFTILCSNYSFTQANFDQALKRINDKKEYEYHDCLVIFIMSHG